MDLREKTCCFTGHRPGKLPWGRNERDERCLALKWNLAERLEALYAAGYRRFVCGMAEGCDHYFAEAVLALRELHPDVSLEAAIPCGPQPDRWTKAQRLRYNSLIDRCDQITVLQIHYTPDCMMKRNRYMVDQSSLLLACFNGSTGGTMNTIVYAQRQGLQVEIIDLEQSAG